MRRCSPRFSSCWAPSFSLQLKDYLEHTLLETQARRARQIGETLIASIPRTGPGAVPTAVEELYAPELSNRFIRITREDGQVLYRLRTAD